MAISSRSWLFLAVAALLIPSALTGQIIQISREIPFLPVEDWPPGTTDKLTDPVAAALTDGCFAAAFERHTENNAEHIYADSGFGQIVCPDGAVGSPFEFGQKTRDPDFFTERPFLVPDGAGGFVVAWRQGRFGGGDVGLRSFFQGAIPQGDSVYLGDSPDFQGDWVTSAAGNATGRFVLGWVETDYLRLTSDVVVQAFVPQTPEVRPSSPVPASVDPEVLVGMDQEGRSLAVWPEEGKILGRWLAPDGTLLEQGPFEVTPGSRPLALAVRPDGMFVMVWMESDAARMIFVNRFARDGRSLRHPLVIGRMGDLQGQWVSSSADSSGNLALAWPRADYPNQISVQFLNRSLVPQGLTVFSGLDRAAVALSDAGKVLLVFDGQGWILGLKKEADVCAYREKRLLCDTGGDDGHHDEVLFFGAGWPLDQPLLGDMDGDGRDDLCLVRKSAFRCDTAHDGGLAELKIPPFKPLGGIPLLGDLDGDGRAEPCLYRDGRFRCDRARDGGQPDLTIVFRGIPGDVPLLGDLDGDGRDDPCLYRDGVFLCDTAHDGGRAETRVNLRGLLGGVRGTPLLGDVNGVSPGDACVVGQGRLICGSLLDGRQFPASVTNRPWLYEGAIPLLGNVDAF